MGVETKNITSFNSVNPVKGVIYRGKTNTLVLQVDEIFPGNDLRAQKKWTSVTKMVLHLVSFNKTTGAALEIVATADTNTDPTLIDYSKDGQLTLKLGGLFTLAGGAIPIDEYLVRLTSYVGAVETQVLHESAQIVRLQFVDTDSI